MAPRLIEEGKIQILGETHNNIVYAVAGDSCTGFAKDTLSVLKGGTVWYEDREALGPGKSAEEADLKARAEADIYKALGPHHRILRFLGLETRESMAWAIRLERALGSLRDCILETAANPPTEKTRLQLAIQFVEGVVHIHDRGIIWGDLSVRNALLFDKWHIKLSDFGESNFMEKYPNDGYGCEVRYGPPGSKWPQRQLIGTSTTNREIFALGTAIYEIVEWKMPYGSPTEVSDDEIITALIKGKSPEITYGNPAVAVIRRCWAYGYISSKEVLTDLKRLS